MIKLTVTKSRQEHLSDLQELHNKIAKVTDDYEDDVDPCTVIRPDDEEKNDEVATLDAKVMSLREEYLRSRRDKVLALGESREGGQRSAKEA